MKINILGKSSELFSAKKFFPRLGLPRRPTGIHAVLDLLEGLDGIVEQERAVALITARVAGLLKAQKCSFMLLDEAKQELFIEGAAGLTPEIVESSRVKVGEEIAGKVARDRTPVLVRDIERDRRFQKKNAAVYRKKSFMSVPVVFGDRTLGVINVSDKQGWMRRSFTDADGWRSYIYGILKCY